jgi:phenylacetate-CoA ligase
MLEKVYNLFRQSPDCARKLMHLVPIERRLGGIAFKNQLEFIQNTDKLPREKLLQLQEKELSRILKHAVRNVPYYKDIKLDDSRNSFENLLKFPIVDKQTVQDNIDQFRSVATSVHNTYYVTTGGTSGNTLGFYLDNSTYGKEWAFIVSLWQRVNYSIGDRVVAFRGVDFKDSNKNKFWQLNPIYNALELSPFQMSDENLKNYLQKINDYNPLFFHGYPSAITILAKYIRSNNIKNIPPLKAVFSGSENIYPGQLEFIEETLQTRFFSWYGQSEKVILAGECEHSHNYHVFPQYGYTEILGKDGSIIPWENIGEQGELVGTGFMNLSMPFIRYKTGDFATIGGWGCEECGRDYPLINNVRGRWLQDMLVGKSRALISMTALNMHSNVFENVSQYQFFQDCEGKVILKVIRKGSYSEKDTQNIQNEFFRKLGNDMELEIEFVDYLSKTRNGKSLMLIQKLPIKSKDFEVISRLKD